MIAQTSRPLCILSPKYHTYLLIPAEENSLKSPLATTVRDTQWATLP